MPIDAAMAKRNLLFGLSIDGHAQPCCKVWRRLVPQVRSAMVKALLLSMLLSLSIEVHASIMLQLHGAFRVGCMRLLH